MRDQHADDELSIHPSVLKPHVRCLQTLTSLQSLLMKLTALAIWYRPMATYSCLHIRKHAHENSFELFCAQHVRGFELLSFV